MKWTTAVVFFLFFLFFILIQTDSVQTWLGKKISTYLSDQLKTEVKVEGVSIDFFSKIDLLGVLIRDRHSDSLLYCGKLYVRVEHLNFSKRDFKLKVSGLEKAVSKVIHYRGETAYNYQFLIHYFSSEAKDTTTSKPVSIDFGTFQIRDLNLYFVDQNNLKPSATFNSSDISIKKLNGDISGIQFKHDSVRMQLRGISFLEKSGFQLRELNGDFLFCPTAISLSDLIIRTDNSYFHGYVGARYDSISDFEDFVNKVQLSLSLEDTSSVGLKDLYYFANTSSPINEKIKVAGKFSGLVNDLKGKEIQIKYGKETEFFGSFNVTDILNPEQLYIHMDIKRLSLSHDDLMSFDFPSYSTEMKSDLLAQIKPFNKLSYKGKIDGFLNEIASKGTLVSDIGTIRCDIGVMNIGNDINPLGYSGKISTRDFDLGKYLFNKDIGKLTASMNIAGEGTELKKIKVEFKGLIESLMYKNYTYHSIELNGDFSNSRFDGLLLAHDPNLDLTFKGVVNFNDKYPDMDFNADIRKIDFSKLYLSPAKDTINCISTQLKINLRGNDLDNLTGDIQLSGTKYRLNNDSCSVNSFGLKLNQAGENKSIHLVSDVLNADLVGKINLSALSKNFTDFLSFHLPDLFKTKFSDNLNKNNDFKFELVVSDFGKTQSLVAPSLNFSPGTYFKGGFNSQKHEILLEGSSSLIQVGKVQIKDWKLNVSPDNSKIKLSTFSSKVQFSDSVYFGKFTLESFVTDKNSDFSLGWKNNSQQKYAGDVQGRISFNDSEFSLKFKKFEVLIADSLWHLDNIDNLVKMDTSLLTEISGIEFVNNDQSLSINGKASRSPEDLLKIDIGNFRLDQLNPILTSSQIQLKGGVSGSCTLARVFEKLIFSSDFDFVSLMLNNKEIGNGKIKTGYDAFQDLIAMDGYFSKGNTVNGKQVNNIEFKGEYFPSRKEDNIDVKLLLKNLDITIIQPYVEGILTFAKQRGGTLEGDISIKGKVSEPIVTGKLNLYNIKNLRVDYLNIYCTANGVVKLFPDRIQLGDDEAAFTKLPEPITISDKDGHEATLWGNIFHKNFSVTKLDFDINAKNFQALNTTAVNNPSYFGRAYVSGNIGIYGDLDYMNMDINLKTEKNTEFNIPLSGPATVEDNDYLIFVKKDSTQNQSQVNYQKSLSGINLNFNLEATPDAVVKMIFDSKSGDVIQAKGNGNIKMVINTNGKFEMYGLYTLSDGNYLFSLENLISKKFDIVNGSTIKWSGDPLNADINITAGYNQNSSLAPFFPSDSTGLYSRPVRASVLLNMKDKLLNPDIGFGIQLPTVDETTRQTVLSYINNEQELNRQVFSLLLLKSFVTPLQLSNQGVGVGAGSTASRTSSEMLSNQLSNWLSQLSTNVDISVNITPEQMDVALSKQLFNDRLSIDGNVGVNNSSGQKTSNMIGDLQVEYKVHPDGKLRVKGFNKSNDNTQISTLGGPFTQGMGVFYREEFNTVDDLYKKYLGWTQRRKKRANEN